HFAPIIEGQFGYRVNVLDAGIGQRNIQPAPLFDDGRNPSLHGLLVSDVHGQSKCRSARLLDGVNGVPGALFGQVSNGDPGTLAGIVFGNGTADTPAGPGNQGNAILKTIHHSLLCCLISDELSAANRLRSPHTLRWATRLPAAQTRTPGPAPVTAVQ